MSNHNKGKFSSRSVAEVIEQPGSQLGRLLAQAKVLDHLNQILQKALDPALGKLTRCTSINESQLSVITPSATLASRLRLETPKIISALIDNSITGICTVKIVIGPLPPEVQRHQRRRKPRQSR